MYSLEFLDFHFQLLRWVPCGVKVLQGMNAVPPHECMLCTDKAVAIHYRGSAPA